MILYKHIKITISLLFISVLSSAQIPNNSFEMWSSTNGYQTPDSWDNLNQITHSSGIYTCNEGTPGYSGTSYLFLSSRAIAGKGVVPGIAVCGTIDTLTYKPKSGFPFSGRPQFLSYYIQYMPYDPSDSSSVKVLLTKWNQTQSKRDTIAYGASYFNSMEHSWFYTTTYLDYVSGNNPDSAIIVVSSSSSVPQNGSYIYIDNLQFNGTVTGIEENLLNSNSVSIFPNPSEGIVNVSINSGVGFPMELIIYDCLGKSISKTLLSNQNNILNVSGLNKGIYTLQVNNKNQVLNNKLIIN